VYGLNVYLCIIGSDWLPHPSCKQFSHSCGVHVGWESGGISLLREKYEDDIQKVDGYSRSTNNPKQNRKSRDILNHTWLIGSLRESILRGLIFKHMFWTICKVMSKTHNTLACHGVPCCGGL
jgi:hypothetical protein